MSATPLHRCGWSASLPGAAAHPFSPSGAASYAARMSSLYCAVNVLRRAVRAPGIRPFRSSAIPSWGTSPSRPSGTNCRALLESGLGRPRPGSLRPRADLAQVPHYQRLRPRLRARLEVERQLIDDAHARGWARDVERHTATLHRIEALLAQLKASPEDAETEGCTVSAQRPASCATLDRGRLST
jgi:hypothetical protein